MTNLDIERETRSSTNKHVADALSSTAIATTAISEFAGIIETLLKASMSNPLIGAITGLLIADIFENTKLLTHDQAVGIRTLIYAASGIALSEQILNGISDFIPKLGGHTPPASILAPSGQVLIFGDKDSIQLDALLKSLASKKV
jgi:hypothetical protein